MKAHQSNGFSSAGRVRQPMSRTAKALDKSVYVTIYDVTLGWILRKLWLGLRKLFVATKYQLHKSTAGFFLGWRLSWFKIGLAGIAVFIILKKDVQFSINMKAPAATLKTPAEQVPKPTRASHQTQELSLSDAVSAWAGNSPKAASIEELNEQQVKGYIHRFTKVAQAEMQKFGIPASIKMAQGIVESGAGASDNARQTNNHFGVPLSGTSYDSAWENWRAHSLLLRGQYPQLFELSNSYKKWAKALKELGYNSDQHYDQKLMDVIEKYQLYLLDEM